MSKTYDITLPIVGVAFMTVEAESATEALEWAIDNVNDDDMHELHPLKHVVRGNVCFHPVPHYSIKELF